MTLYQQTENIHMHTQVFLNVIVSILADLPERFVTALCQKMLCISLCWYLLSLLLSLFPSSHLRSFGHPSLISHVVNYLCAPIKHNILTIYQNQH